MSDAKEKPVCPHCSMEMKAFTIPIETGWDDPHQWACFNDECSYYKEGWNWMWEKYQAKASYRYRIVPGSKKNTPLAVWSHTAIRDRIIDADL